MKNLFNIVIILIVAIPLFAQDDNPPAVGYIPDQTVNEGEAFSIFDLDNYLTELDGDSIAWSYSIPGQEPDPVFVVIATGDTTVYPLQIGFSEDATDGYDQGVDQYAPPAPPPPSFDAALSWDSDRYYTQIVADDGDTSEHVFDVQLQYPSSDLITLTWDNTGWSDLGSFILQDAFGGGMINVDMTQETSLTLDNPAFNTLKWKVTPTYLQGETQNRDLMVDIDEENVATVSYSDGWSGSEEVIFTAKDQTEAGLSDSDGATFTVIANTPPVADDIAVTTNEDMAVDIILTGSDAESGVLAYHVVAPPTDGILTGEANSLLYTPDENYNGGDSFNYFVSDGIDSSNVATVSITVDPVDDSPEVAEIPDQSVNDGEEFEPFDLDDYLTELDEDEVTWSYEIEGQEPEPGFAVSLQTVGGLGDYDLTVGFASNATDGYDFGIDQYAPPAPPPPAFDAALGWGGDRYYTQILADDGNYSEHVFDVQLAYPSDNLVTLTWDNTGWEDLGTFILQDAFDGLLGIDVDMTQENSLTLDNPALNTLKWKVTPTSLEGDSQNRDLTVDIDEGNVVTVTYPTGWIGSEGIIFIVTDETEAALSDSDNVIFTVSPVDDPPIVEGIPDQSVTAPELFTTFDLDEYLTELDGDDIVWSYEITSNDGPSYPTFVLNAAGGDFGTSYDLTVGFSEDATDGYDEGIDIYAPPAPPPPSFDAALGWVGDRYYTQVLTDDGDYSEHVFDVQLAYPSDNLITLTWDNTGWADFGTFFLQDAFGGLLGIDVDMTQENSLTLDNPALNTLKWMVTPMETDGGGEEEGLSVIIDSSNVVTVAYTAGWTGSGEITFIATDQTATALSGSDNAVFIVEPSVTIVEEVGIPTVFTLHQNYPNPFNPVTTLRYDLPDENNITLTIYDLNGKEINQLVNINQPAGYRSVQWNATDMRGKPVSAGVYLYQIRAGAFVQTKKMVLLK